MITAHTDLPSRDFDWLIADPTLPPEEVEIPEVEPEPEVRRSDPRAAFYDDLSSDFGSAQDEQPRPEDQPYDQPFVDERPRPYEPPPEPYRANRVGCRRWAGYVGRHMRPPILALKAVRLADGPKMLFDGVEIGLESRVRACLVGRNGGRQDHTAEGSGRRD